MKACYHGFQDIYGMTRGVFGIGDISVVNRFRSPNYEEQRTIGNSWKHYYSQSKCIFSIIKGGYDVGGVDRAPNDGW